MAITEEELIELIGIKANIEKISTLSSDGRNLLIRIPKEVKDFLKLEKGDKFRWLVDEDNIKIEVVK